MDNKRSSLALFSELKTDDGLPKIALRAATHADAIIRMTKDIILTWSCKEVIDKFLRICELDCYVDTFYEEGVDGKLLLELSQTECEDDLLMNSLDARYVVMCTTYLSAAT